MSGGFADLDEVLGSPKKQLPIGGKVYEFPDRITASTGRLMLRMYEAGRENPDLLVDGDALLTELAGDIALPDLYTEVLGDAYDELTEAGVQGDRLAHVLRTLIVWHIYGEAVAEQAWANPGGAPAPNRAARRASSGTAKSTRSRGSTTGTTSRSKPRKAASPGRRSSTTGR